MPARRRGYGPGVTDTGAVADHDELRRTAHRRTRRGRSATVAGVAVLVIGVPLLTWLVIGGPPTPLRLAVAIVPTAVGVLAGLAALRLLRGRGRDGDRPALVLGADPDTRRSVREALRTGRARDARVDALARDAAERSTGTLRGQQIIFGVLAAVWVIGLGLRLAGGDGVGESALSAVTLVLFAAVWVVTTRQRRRSLRYLREGRPAGHDDRAA